MNFPPESAKELEFYLREEPSGEIPTFYTLQIGRLFCSISFLEQATHGLLMTRATSQTFKSLHNKLRKSTFGQLVGKLEQEGVEGRDLSYLRKINKLRNEIIHGLFWDFPFPGDPEMSAADLSTIMKRMEQLHRHFRFAEANLTAIMIRAGLFRVQDIGEAGQVLYPLGLGVEPEL